MKLNWKRNNIWFFDDTWNGRYCCKLLQWFFCFTNSLLLCPTAEYYENGHCHQCHSTCETCMGPTEKDCLTCSNNLLLQNNKCVSTCDKGYFMEAGICTQCLHTCASCVSRLNCTECVKGLQLQSGECQATCANGWVHRITHERMKTMAGGELSRGFNFDGVTITLVLVNLWKSFQNCNYSRQQTVAIIAISLCLFEQKRISERDWRQFYSI